MSHPPADEVYNILKRIEPQLMSVHLKAWERLVSNSDWATLVFSRTSSTLMNDFIAQESGATLDEIPGVRRISHENSVRYLIDDKLLFRFKKGTKNGLGSNIDTQANDDFIDAQVDLLGIPELWKVELLWYANRLRTKLDRVEVSSRNHKRRIWSYALGGEPDIATLPFDLPVDPTAPARTGERLVVVKSRPRAKNEDE